MVRKNRDLSMIANAILIGGGIWAFLVVNTTIPFDVDAIATGYNGIKIIAGALVASALVRFSDKFI